MASETSLYQINNNIQKIRKIFEDMDNDVDSQALIDTLDSLKDAQSSKIDGIASWSDNLEAQNDWIDKKMKQLTQLKKRNTKLIEWINKYIADSLEASGSKKLQTDNHLITLRTSKRVVIDDEKALPEKFIVTKTESKPDKKALRKALLAEDTPDGGEISGAHLAKNTKAVIR